MKTVVSLLAVLSLGACSDGTGPAAPPTTPFPLVHLTRSFGDTPLETSIVFKPTAPGSFAFSIDLDGDGTADQNGTARERVEIPHSLDAIGAHRLSVRLTASGRDSLVQLTAVVNDPAGSALVGEASILPGVDLEGVLAAEVDGEDVLFVGAFSGQSVHRIDPVALVVEASQLLPLSSGRPEGLALEPDGSTLYVITKSSHLLALDPGSLEILEDIFLDGPTRPQFFVHAEGGRRVLTGNDGLTRIDMESGSVVQERVLQDGFHFHVGPDGSRIAFLQDVGGVVRLLEPGFADLWQTSLPAGFRYVFLLADPDRVYVFGTERASDNVTVLRFVVLDGTTGRIMSDRLIEGCVQCSILNGFANPVAMSDDGRHVILPTELGVYLIDTSSDTVVHRTSSPAVSCCNVAAVAGGSDFFIAGAAGRIARYRILR